MLDLIHRYPRGRGVYFKLPSSINARIGIDLELNLNKHYSECGCGAGSIGSKIGLSISALIFLIEYFLGGEKFFEFWYIIPIPILSGVLLGKAIGIIKARGKFHEVLSVIQSLWNTKIDITKH